MNESLSQFMRIALTAIVIVALLFSVGYQMVDEKTDEYKTSSIDTLPQPETSGAESR